MLNAMEELSEGNENFLGMMQWKKSSKEFKSSEPSSGSFSSLFSSHLIVRALQVLLMSSKLVRSTNITESLNLLLGTFSLTK
uniref:Uncharacterized protein n=1 Tax=Parascaris univalens TaxID=6257 RepID=A0A915AGS1_PARUN